MFQFALFLLGSLVFGYGFILGSRAEGDELVLGYQLVALVLGSVTVVAFLGWLVLGKENRHWGMAALGMFLAMIHFLL